MRMEESQAISALHANNALRLKILESLLVAS
jgi:hypothetical protein